MHKKACPRFKACAKKFNYTGDFCQQVVYEGANQTVLDDLSKVVSSYESNLSFAAFAPRILFALLAGYWSDRNGRKLLIGFPIFGQCLTSLTYHFGDGTYFRGTVDNTGRPAQGELYTKDQQLR